MASINHLSYKHSGLCRTVFYAAFALVLCLAVPVNAQEATPAAIPDIVEALDLEAVKDPYTVEGIEVDITADNAVEAREQAFEAAQIKGYEELAKRILGAEKFADFETPDINVISSYVRDYEVTNEKLSAVRYNGTYKIRYSKKAFQNYKTAADESSSGIPQITQDGDVLVLPFFQYGNRSFLWQANPFMQAWVRARNNQMAGNVIVPIGDINDITQVREEQALTYDPTRLNTMRRRYEANSVAILTATPSFLPDGSQNIRISLYNAQPYGPSLMRQISVRGFRGESEEQLYNRVVRESKKLLGDVSPPMQQAATAPVDTPASTLPEAVITTQVGFTTMREWIETKKSLERVYGVNGVKVQTMSPRGAIINIRYHGGLEDLRLALQQSGMMLNNPAQGNVYQLMKTMPPTTIY